MGQASWYDFAVAIAEIAVEQGLFVRTPPIERITTAELHPTPRALRPDYGVLDASRSWNAFGSTARDWREALAVTVKEIASGARL
jgi:dTDP-4-dehydrorhamnose reductase